MIDLLKIFKKHNVDASIYSDLEDSIKKEIGTSFVPKSQYNKKVTEIDTLTEANNDLSAKLENASKDTYKEKYETLQSEYDTYKTSIANEKTNSNKKEIIKRSLVAEGVNDKLIPLLIKEFDIDKIEIEENKVKDWETVVNPLKESYGDFFTKKSPSGTPPTKTPNPMPNGKFTREMIQSMTREEIMKNYQAIKDSGSLQNL